MTRKQQQIVAVAALSAVVLAVLAYFFAVKPKLAERAQSQTATSAAQAETEQLQSQLTMLERKRAELPTAERQVRELTRMFPHTFEQDTWISMVRRLANDAGVSLSQVTPGVPVAAGADAPPSAGPAAPTAAASNFLVAESIVTITANGRAAAIERFLRGLQDMERPLLVEAVTITLDDDKGEGALNVTGKTFLSRPMGPAPAVVSGHAPAPAPAP